MTKEEKQEGVEEMAGSKIAHAPAHNRTLPAPVDDEHSPVHELMDT